MIIVFRSLVFKTLPNQITLSFEHLNAQTKNAQLKSFNNIKLLINNSIQLITICQGDKKWVWKNLTLKKSE